jgi:hypothetical protein
VRVKRLTISSELFCAIFSAGQHGAYTVVQNGIPDDARLINLRHAWPSAIELLLESERFDEVREGEVIPEFSPLIMDGVVQTADA